jgi:hypothetical protein
MSLFQTKIKVSPDTPIIALSDIHADIDFLIIALRDCAQVIRKKQNQRLINPDGTNIEPKLLIDKSSITEENIRDNNNDQLLEYLLGFNINDSTLEETYKKNVDLGYEWIGRNTHVVIIGDILDGLRSSGTGVETPLKTSLAEFANQYPQIEVKILMFLNKLDELAMKSGGRVLKLIGNHEHLNFKNSPGINNYAFANGINTFGIENKYFKNTTVDNNISALRKKDYYQNLSRREYFNLDKPGYDLFVNRGSGVLLIIDNSIHQYVFCHGTLSNRITYTELDEINKIINNGELKRMYSTKNINGLTKTFIEEFYEDKTKTIPEDVLWGRDMGDDEKINKRFDNNNYCKFNVEPIIEEFCNNNGTKICEKNKIKIIIGHCVQSYSTFYSNKNRTFSNIVYEDDKIIKFDGTTVHEGIADLSNNFIFGITIECNSPEETSPKPGDNKRIYRVDIGASRAFDQDIEKYIANDKSVNDENIKKFLHSRTPQILKINNGQMEIIKSKFENTMKYQPRVWLESLFNKLKIDHKKIDHRKIDHKKIDPEITKKVVSIGGGYYEKYLKYKKKYMLLKNINK